MVDEATDAAVRQAAFEYMVELTRFCDVIHRSKLEQGFRFRDHQIPLVSPQGIFKPGMLDVPLTLTSTLSGPYSDDFGGKYISYAYRGRGKEEDIWHRDNKGMRQAWMQGKPLIYLVSIAPSRYMAAWPVFIVADDPANHRVTLSVGSAAKSFLPGQVAEPEAPYGPTKTVLFMQKASLGIFQEQVLRAYRHKCAMCSLTYTSLLDAAHITPREEGGEMQINNGLALCKLHNAAFNEHLLGINPKLQIEVQPAVLRESDGPMLRHGLQEMKGRRILLPQKREWKPDARALEARYYEKFLKAG